MKIRNIAFVAMVVSCGQAYALSPAEVSAAATVKLYVSGASAMRNIIGGLFTQHCQTGVGVVGDPNYVPALDIYYSAIGTFSGAAFTAAGDAHRVYTCKMTASSPLLPGKQVALFKSDIGGSGQGVFPVHGMTPRGFLSLSSGCSARVNTVPNAVCTGEQQQVPMAGVSDVEPSMFVGANVPKDGVPAYVELTTDQVGELDTAPLFQTIFGVAVNKSLRNAMQTAQGLSFDSELDAQQPSISRAMATSYFGGVLSAPSQGLGWQPIVAASDAKKATRVNVCRRVDGSGTQASANAFFNQFPCGSSPQPIADKSLSALPQSVNSVGTSGEVFVFEGSSTGNVISCLNKAEEAAVGAYAIGHVSKENAPATTGTIGQWRHLKLDGVAPSRDNVKTGGYDYFFESTMQWRTAKFDSLDIDQQDFLTQFRAEAGKPDSLAKLPVTTQNGVAALPGTVTAPFGAGTANENTFGSRVSRGGNSCSPVIAYK